VASRSLSLTKLFNSAQRAYGIPQKEVLAALLSMEKFAYYLRGRTFTLVTDHQPIKWLVERPAAEGMMSRWLERFLCFDFTVWYVEGKRNVAPDFLTRLPIDEEAVLAEKAAEKTALTEKVAPAQENFDAQALFPDEPAPALENDVEAAQQRPSQHHKNSKRTSTPSTTLRCLPCYCWEDEKCNNLKRAMLPDETCHARNSAGSRKRSKPGVGGPKRR